MLGLDRRKAFQNNLQTTYLVLIPIMKCVSMAAFWPCILAMCPYMEVTQMTHGQIHGYTLAIYFLWFWPSLDGQSRDRADICRRRLRFADCRIDVRMSCFRVACVLTPFLLRKRAI